VSSSEHVIDEKMHVKNMFHSLWPSG